MGLFSWIGDIVGDWLSPKNVMGLAGGAMDAATSKSINDANIAAQYAVNRENRASAEAINAANLAYADKSNAMQLDNQNTINEANLGFARETNIQNAALAREVAQNSILWRVNDAKAAGVHPLFALGAQGASPATMMAPTSSSSFNPASVSLQRSDSVAPVRQMGQGLGRAIAAMQTKEERAQADRDNLYTEALRGVQLEGAALQNEFTRAQIASLQSRDQVGPPKPSIRSMREYEDPRVRVAPKPSQPVIGAAGQPSREPGNITDFRYRHHPDGGVGLTYSEDAKNSTEDDVFEQTQWQIRNRITPFLKREAPPAPPAAMLPKGAKRWRWSFINQAFYPVYKESNHGSSSLPSGKKVISSWPRASYR